MAEEPAANPCCSVWKFQYTEVVAKRNALREAVNLLSAHINKIEAENLTISKALEEERARVEAEKDANAKESVVRVELENEVLQLKSEITSLQENVYAREELLQTQISQGEAENKRLKELLEKEKMRGDAEIKKDEAEKSKLDGETQMIDKDLIQKQVSAEIHRFKELLANEMKKEDSDKKKALESLELLEAEMSKADGEKMMVDIERNQVEELKTTLEALKYEACESRIKLGTERSKYEEAKKKLKAEKFKANWEKKRADSGKAKAELQKRCAEEERKKLLNEEYRSDALSKRLEEEKKRSEELERKVQDIMSEKVEKVCPEESDRQHENVNTNAANANMVLLEKQLELEKKHVKHAKKVAKFEKRRNDLLQQEIFRLKQDLQQFCHRLNLLGGSFFHGVEGIDASAKGTSDLPKLP
ncbi:hypothetical protein MKX03_028774 [Papaver bracteatum]|nr:hypothetical protein MKX03_028774 [Papaver bracteatum]